MKREKKKRGRKKQRKTTNTSVSQSTTPTKKKKKKPGEFQLIMILLLIILLLFLSSQPASNYWQIGCTSPVNTAALRGATAIVLVYQHCYRPEEYARPVRSSCLEY